jgi:hypothetical protein
LQRFNGGISAMHGKIIYEKMFCRLTLLAAVVLSGSAAAIGQGRAPVAQLSVHWQNLPLGEAVDRLRNVTGATVFVDRRVDPEQRVDLAANNATVAEVLTNLASATGLGHVELGHLHYLGPRLTAEGLPAAAAAQRRDVAGLDPEIRKQLLNRRRLAWPRLTEPRGLVEQLLKQQGWRLSNPEAIPHDLWPVGEMPATSLVDQLTVLLAGFDLTFRIRPEQRSIVIVPANWQRGDSSHAKRPPPRRQAPTSRTPSKQVFTLRVENQPVGRVLQQLATRLGWRLEIDEPAVRGAGRSLDTLVSFEVKNASEQELLEALLKPAGLSATLVGDKLRITPEK